MSEANRILFIGSKQLGLRVLNEMYAISPKKLIGILTIDDSEDSRSVLNDFREFSRKTGLNIHIAKNRSDSEEKIFKTGPDLCIVACWYWLISNKTLNSVPLGFIGIHNSLLPKYRGGSPLVWSIINDEKRVGVSLFSFTEGMDEGNIWAQEVINVNEQDYISDIIKNLEEKTIQIIRDTYVKIIDGKATSKEQEHELATYCAQRIPDDGQINWLMSARTIFNFIRAQSDPYPGAFTYIKNQKLIIWRARLHNYPYYGTPGQVAKICSEGVYVICGDNRAIIIEEVERDGKRGSACDLIKSSKIRM